MEIAFTPRAKRELEEFRIAGKTKILQKIRSLIESISATPFEGIGKPEQLMYDLAGKWNRRISKEDRIIYAVNENLIMIFAVKGHYE